MLLTSCLRRLVDRLPRKWFIDLPAQNRNSNLSSRVILKRTIQALFRLGKAFCKSPRRLAKAAESVNQADTSNHRIYAQAVDAVKPACNGLEFSQNYTEPKRSAQPQASLSTNPLWDYFQGHTEGLGIFKWEHYFEVYHRHFQRFIGKPVDLLEIGIFSGGSLGMWRSYFGEQCHVYGVDIDEKCRRYESKEISVFIGDQEDRNFWKSFREQVNGVDLIVDDGGHTPAQQQTTLEEMLPFLRPGGVYVCEDIHGIGNQFNAFAAALVDNLNAHQLTARGSALKSAVTPFQAHVHSIHFYPYIVVIEKHHSPITQLCAPKHGSEW